MAASERLRALESALDGPLTLAELVHKLRHSGFALVVVLVCLPFLQPVPMGGLSSVIGPFVAWMGVSLARGRKELTLPEWLGRRRIEEGALKLLLGTARRAFALAERVARPRWTALARAERAAGAGIALSGCLLSLPFPIPLSNMICGGPATLLALGLLEDDGLLAALGWAALALSVAFHAGLAMLGADGARALWGAAFS